MVNQKRIFALIGILLFAVLALGIGFHFITKRTYELHLPQSENLELVSLKQNGEETVIHDSGKIEEILDTIGGTQRTTKEESIQDTPVNANGEIRVDFHFTEGGTSTLFIYEKNGKYFIEQPYNGIYPMGEEEYLRLLATCGMEPSDLLSNSRTPDDSSEPSLDFQMPDNPSVTTILHDGIEYHPYGIPEKADMSEQIGTVNGDAKHKVYAFRDYPIADFIIEFYESGLMDTPMLFRATDCNTEPEDMYILEEN